MHKCAPEMHSCILFDNMTQDKPLVLVYSTQLRSRLRQSSIIKNDQFVQQGNKSQIY